MKKFLNIICLTAAFTLLFLHTDFSVSAKALDEDVIESGIYIGDVDVSGLTASEAMQKVTEYMDTIGEKKLTLNAMNNNTVVISMNDLEINWINTEIVQDAVKIAKDGNLVARYKVKKDLEHENLVIPMEYEVEKDAALKIISDKCKKYNVSAEDATLTREDGEFVIVPGQVGVVIDEEASADAIVSFVSDGWDGQDASIDLVVDTDEPRGSEEELAKVKDLLGSFTTDYSTSGSNRSGNVANGCSLINGSLLYPGDTFSVYEAVSPFTADNGYYMAGSYLNGLVVESLGGGICQVSTTLYNAVLRAELTVKDRYNHSMIVTYVDPSADAAISGTTKDLKFVNSTDYPIYIEGYTTPDKHITFTIYGVENRDPNREVDYESVVLERTVPDTEVIYTDASQPVGYCVVQSAHVGYKAQLWKVVKENGVEVSREQVNSSTYMKAPRSATVGIATEDPGAYEAIMAAVATNSVDQVKAVAGSYKAAADAAAAQAAAEAAAQQAAQQQEAPPAQEAPPTE